MYNRSRLGSWQDIKDEFTLDVNALQYLPSETVKTVRGGYDAIAAPIRNTLVNLSAEASTDLNAIQFLPHEIGKSIADIVTPVYDKGTKPAMDITNNLKWLGIALVVGYALWEISPAVRKYAKKV